MSGVNQLVIDNFLCPVSGAVHLPNPLYLILNLELFCDTILFCQSFNQLKKHDFCLGINLSQMIVQLAIEK